MKLNLDVLLHQDPLLQNDELMEGPPLIHRSGVVDLDGEGHLDLVSSLQGTLFRVTEDDPEAKQESIVTTQTFISKRKANEE